MYDYSVSQPPAPLGDLTFCHFFHKRLRICNRFFTHLLIVPIFARLQIFIQLSLILTKLCHIKHDYPVHIICAKYPKRAITRAFRRLCKSLIALLIVVCGKSLKNKHFYDVNKHDCWIRYDTIEEFNVDSKGYDMIWRQQWRHFLSKQT